MKKGLNMNRIDFYNAFIIVFLAGTIVSFLINQFLEWIDFGSGAEAAEKFLLS